MKIILVIGVVLNTCLAILSVARAPAALPQGWWQVHSRTGRNGRFISLQSFIPRNLCIFIDFSNGLMGIHLLRDSVLQTQAYFASAPSPWESWISLLWELKALMTQKPIVRAHLQRPPSSRYQFFPLSYQSEAIPRVSYSPPGQTNCGPDCSMKRTQCIYSCSETCTGSMNTVK